MNSGHQFRDGEGLENDVIRPGIQARDALLNSGRSGKKNKRDVGPALLKSGDEFQTGNSGEAQVKENQIEQGTFRKMSESVSRRNQLHDKVILLEDVLEKLSQRRISLCYK